jgi:NDP-sugar pyrophosphorylase family protein
VRSPSLFLKANLDGLRWYLDSLINYDPASSAKYKERLLRTNGHHSFYCQDARLAFDSKLGSNTLVLDGASVGEKASLHESVVGQLAAVGDLSNLERSLVGKSAKIGKACVLRDALVGRNCTIGDHCRIVASVIEEGAVLADGEKVDNEVVAKDGTRTPYQSKASYNKFILEDELELDFEGDDDEFVEEIGRYSVIRL